MRSLRARLIAGLLALTAIGLVVLASVTYATQRSFLLDRVDEQVRSAVGAVQRSLDGEDAGGGARGPRGPRGPGGRRGSRGGPPVQLPPGTYGQRRDGAGRVVGEVVLGYGSTDTAPRPRLPAAVPGDALLTVPALGADDVEFRVDAAPAPGGGTTIVAVPLTEVERALDNLLLVSGLVIAAVLALLGLGAGLLVRLGLRPLDRMGATAGAIAAGDLSRRVEPATAQTEVGRLGLALNGMLARLEEAFAERRASEERLRTFLSDASHELRTPLASIRGYAELFRMGAARDPEQSARAMARIEAEAARMGVLVEDLLVLARLDELREPARDEVDVAALARDAVDDARVRAPEREVTVTAEAPARMRGDAHALRQVLTNLLGNALAHTPAGTPVEVTVRGGPDTVRVDVRDHGPGLPGDDPQALFARFWRAEGGRERGRAGAGLGLAIVAGIVEQHGGHVRAANEPGGGARFTVVLPTGPANGRPAAGVAAPGAGAVRLPAPG